MRLPGFLLAILVAAGAASAGCPPVPDRSAEMQALVAEIQAARTEAEARGVARRMWNIWNAAPDDRAQVLLNRGFAASARRDLLSAFESFDALIAYCPDFAGGYNQRAFMYFLDAKFDKALPDLDRAIELDPLHIPALSGRAMTLMAMGRLEEAQDELRRVLKINPWLPERRYLIQPEGKDL